MTKKKSRHLMPVPEPVQDLTDSVSNPVSNSVSNWEPTPKQSALLAAAGKIGLGLTITAVCKKAGVSRERFYQSMKQPGFVARWNELARQIVQTAVPGAASAMGQKAADGDTTAARLIFQAGKLIGSGMDVHIGDRIDKQLTLQRNQPPYGDHRDIIFRAKNMAEFEICKKIGEGVAVEVAAMEAKGETPLTNEQHLLAIKLGTEKAIADNAAKEAAEEVAAGQGEVIDVTPAGAAEED